MYSDEGMYYEVVDLKFSNGYELKGVKDWGGSYVTEEAVSFDDLAGGLTRVEVRNVETGEVNIIEHAWLEECMRLSDVGGTRISLRELGYFERQEMQLRSNVEYLAMMMGVEL